MTVLLRLIAANAQYIYALCALVALYYLRVALLARRDRRSAIFPLEREVASSRTYRAFGIALLLAAVMGIAWAATNRLLPRLEQIAVLTTPTPDRIILIDTPTPTLAPPTLTPTSTAPTSTPRPLRTPTLELRPTATKAPPLVQLPSCPNPGAAIAGPGVGQLISGAVQVTGSASIDRFQFYKLEWSPAAAEQWNWFAGSDKPVVGGVLGVFNGGGLPSGAYVIRLVVVDATGNYPSPCTVQVVVP